MFRYLAWAWNTTNPQQCDAAQALASRLQGLGSHWRPALSREGLKIFCADAGSLQTLKLARACGVVLGTVYERNLNADDPAAAPQAVLSVEQTDAIVNSHGQFLIAGYWGNYVAFIGSPFTAATAAGHMWVVKDPSGDLPCFTTPFRGLQLFFSCVTDCMDLRVPLALNPKYLVNRVLYGGAHRGHRALCDVWEIQRGECLEVDCGHEPTRVSRRFYWTPTSFDRSDQLITDPDDAARAIRATVRSATHTLASKHKDLLLRLSGGLDSSIISGCLKHASSRVTCHTYFMPRSRSDERPWARLAAGFAGHVHVERAIRPQDIPLPSALRMPAAIEPRSVMEYIQRTTVERELAAAQGATAVFTGDGGDSGFCSDSYRHALSEFLHQQGLRATAFRLANQIALQSQLSVWTVWLRAFRKQPGSHHPALERDSLYKICRLVSPELVATLRPLEYRDHPWLRATAGIPPGILERVGMLAVPADFYCGANPADGWATEIISPLYSQPVTELLLRIPIYLHFEGGRDRGLARRAFSQDVPSPILQRHWKDRAPGFHDELVHRNLSFLREFFLDGQLVAEGLLDRHACEQALSTAVGKSEVSPAEIINHMGTEIWARQWRQAQSRTAAGL